MCTLKGKQISVTIWVIIIHPVMMNEEACRPVWTPMCQSRLGSLHSVPTQKLSLLPRGAGAEPLHEGGGGAGGTRGALLGDLGSGSQGEQCVSPTHVIQMRTHGPFLGEETSAHPLIAPSTHQNSWLSADHVQSCLPKPVPLSPMGELQTTVVSRARFLTQEPVGLFALVSCQVFIMTTWTDDPDSGSSGYLCLAKSGWKSGLPCLSFSLILSQKMNKASLFLSYHSSSFLMTHHIPKQPHVSTHILKPAI